MAKGKYEQWLTDEGLLLIEGWARDGLTDEQIAHNIGISRKTLHEWKTKYSNIGDALKKGKEVVDRQVENALLKRALGFHFQEEVATPTGVEQITRYEKPDVTAAIFWLKNRKPGIWRNKESFEVAKVKADTEFVQERTKLLKGAAKDTSLLEALIGAVNDNG
jgi:DNA-binding XRE family transcriptional regulator